MKNNILKPQMMLLEREQGGAQKPFRPRSSSDAALCVDLRTGGRGHLECVGLPRLLATLPLKPLFTETRLGITYIFACDESRRLSIVGSVNQAGDFSECDEYLGILPADYSCATTAGSFLVLSLADSTLIYLLFNPDTCSYTYLGPLPEMPAVEAEVVGEVTLTEEVPSVVLTDTEQAQDLRKDVPETLEKRLGAAVETARKRLMRSANLAGMWTQPVAVRVAMRLWDGELLHLSAPVVATADGYQAPLRTLLPLASGATQTASISMQAYQIALRVGSVNLKRWSAVVRSIEVWVTEEQDPIDETVAPSASYFNSTASGESLVVVIRQKENQTLADELLQREMRRVKRTVAESFSSEMLIRCQPGAAKGMPGLERNADLPRKAAILEGHDGFLHLAAIKSRIAAPTLPHGIGSELSECTVAVRLGAEEDGTYVVAKGKIACTDGRIIPLLWYPSAKAEAMIVRVETPSGRLFQQTFQLTPSTGEEDFAAFVSNGLKPIQLTAVSKFLYPETGLEAREETAHQMVVTTKRGNPFAVAHVTEQIGSEVAALKCQPMGGGAFTRQYLYAFTAKGILAITLDSSGRHRTARTVSLASVQSAQKVVATDLGIFVASTEGELLRLTDSRTLCLLRGLPPVAAMGWQSRFNELWITFTEEYGDRSLAIELDFAGLTKVEASMRSCRPTNLISREGQLLFSYPWGRNWRVYDVGAAPKADTRAEGLWVSQPFAARQGATWLDVDVQGSPAKVAVSLAALHPEEDSDNDAEHDGLEIDRMANDSSIGLKMTMPLGLPAEKRARRTRQRYRLRLSGEFRSFRGVNL